jgi:hypothetical protein
MGGALYGKQNLIERYGMDIRLPDLREDFSVQASTSPDCRILFVTAFGSGIIIAN